MSKNTINVIQRAVYENPLPSGSNWKSGLCAYLKNAQENNLSASCLACLIILFCTLYTFNFGMAHTCRVPIFSESREASALREFYLKWAVHAAGAKSAERVTCLLSRPIRHGKCAKSITHAAPTSNSLCFTSHFHLPPDQKAHVTNDAPRATKALTQNYTIG